MKKTKMKWTLKRVINRIKHKIWAIYASHYRECWRCRYFHNGSCAGDDEDCK